MRRILDAKYKKADLNKVMIEQWQHLIPRKQKSLLNILKTFEDLFDGSLGMWNNAPVDFESKDDVNPVCSRPYPLPMVHKSIFRK